MARRARSAAGAHAPHRPPPLPRPAAQPQARPNAGERERGGVGLVLSAVFNCASSSRISFTVRQLQLLPLNRVVDGAGEKVADDGDEDAGNEGREGLELFPAVFLIRFCSFFSPSSIRLSRASRAAAASANRASSRSLHRDLGRTRTVAAKCLDSSPVARTGRFSTKVERETSAGGDC
jgi:hypothetical protein